MTSLIQKSTPSPIRVRGNLESTYADVYTPQALAALAALAHFNRPQQALMAARIDRRLRRFRNQETIQFLNADDCIGGARINVQDAREGNFIGAEIPADLQRQWIQGTGPAARPHASVESSIRNVAYALLSGADGWMFDGEDALGQVKTMSLDNQRNLKLAIHKDPVFMDAAERVAEEMNAWAQGFFGHNTIDDWRAQLSFTTKIFRARGLHLDDRHIRDGDGGSFSASIVDLVLYVVNNHERLISEGSSIVLYLPKIQTAEEAALWNDMLIALEAHLGLETGAIKVYVLVEQLEATFQLMEIRAALGKHFGRLQHGPVGLHQQRGRRAGVEAGFHQSEHRRHHDDLRLHAQLRRSCSPGREHARQRRTLRALARRHGTEHPGGVARRGRQ